MKSKVRKAVFPVAGLGTRFLPATKAMPKELLPIIDKPLIQYAAEEAIAAGLDTLIFITGRNKRAIEDHFDGNNELELALRSKGKNEMADMVKNILPEGVECVFVRQKQACLYSHRKENVSGHVNAQHHSGNIDRGVVRAVVSIYFKISVRYRPIPRHVIRNLGSS